MATGSVRWRVAVVEDHLLQRQRTEEILSREPDVEIAASCDTLPEFIGWLSRCPASRWPQLLILDLSVDRGPSVEPDAVRRLVRSGIRVLVFSAMSSPSLVRSMLRSGVSGVVGKRDPETSVVHAIRTVLDGREWLTPELAAVIAGDAGRPELSDQEERALVLYASGLTLASVAEAMGVQPETAKTYLTRVKSKYGALGREVRSKLDISRVAREDGYLDD